MNRPNLIFTLAALSFLIAGCSSPMQKTLAKTPDWKKYSQHIPIEHNSVPNDLTWQPFPDPSNPLHREIWEAAQKHGEIGDGFGIICRYYDSYLVIVANSSWQGFSSFFYDPKFHFVNEANYSLAFTLYRGDRAATATNVISVVQHLLAAEPYESFVVSDPNDIPHTQFSKDNPNVPFREMLLAKGIMITPPIFKYNEFNVYVYMPVGGQIFRYEMECGKGIIFRVTQYRIADRIGDAWYLM